MLDGDPLLPNASPDFTIRNPEAPPQPQMVVYAHDDQHLLASQPQALSLLVNDGRPLELRHVMSPHTEISCFRDRLARLKAADGRPDARYVRNPLGKLTPLCLRCGRQDICLLAPGAHVNWFWISTIVIAVCVLFAIFVPDSGEVWSTVLVCALGGTALVLMVLASTLDPGVIPPRREDEPVIDQHQLIALGGARAQQHASSTAREQVVTMLEPCSSCQTLRPPRSSHCRRADVCLLEFDHACGVVGSVVARRTFGLFVLQLLFYVLFALAVCVRSVVAAVMLFSGQHPGGSSTRQVIVVLLAAIGGICTLWVGLGPLSNYMYLAGKGITLKDAARKVFVRDDPPWSCGTCLSQLFCSCCAESYLQPVMAVV